jgi:hypothetical protein
MRLVWAVNVSLLFTQQQRSLLVSNRLGRETERMAREEQPGQQTSGVSGKTNQEGHRQVARENRIAVLEESTPRSVAEQSELNGLRDKSAIFEEQYDPSQFSEAHHAFKRAHNQAFCALAKYCCEKDDDEPMLLFYLDGADAKTTIALLQSEFCAEQLYVANRHETSCVELRKRLPAANVVCQSATISLQDGFQLDNFGAFYLDGCGGYVPQVTEMAAAALSRANRNRVALGFSLVGGNRDVVNKEVAVVQYLVSIMSDEYNVHHVMDDPIRYGVSPAIRKLEGATLTSWFIFERKKCQ